MPDKLIVPIKLKSEILKTILSQHNPFGGSENQEGILEFILKIWDLRTMPSQDPRFDDAYGDFYQHLVNNDDWNYDYLFNERLNLLKDDENFIVFVETVISPEIRRNEDEISKFYLLLNPYFEKANLFLSVSDFDVETQLPIYKVKSKGEIADVPYGLKINSIPFFVVDPDKGWANRIHSHSPPSKFPSFVLAYNDRWNDYSNWTEFFLYYYDENQEGFSIGKTKIMHSEKSNTFEIIPKEFTKLEDSFCSLGQDQGFYFNLKKYFEKNFESVLYSLRDASFFPEILEKYENHRTFINSLIRDDEVERLLREIKYKLFGYELKNLYSFKYSFTPKFSDSTIDIDFQFNNDHPFPNRVYAIIGKNGTGKTQLITSLPVAISKKNIDLFIPKVPLFSKVIAVSYSAFDSFEIPKRTASFNYIYCGLKNEDGKDISDSGLVNRFHHSWKRIKELGRMKQWIAILLNFLEEDIISEFIIEKRKDYEVDIKEFSKARNKLSSGQSIILYIITQIVANIRYDSLLIYDEPETHLHPNAISQLTNTVYELVYQFESYCILATHSPLIIRDILSKNVYIIERHNNVPSIRKIGIESFGENLTTLTEEVFGNKEIPKQYKKIIENLKLSGKSSLEIIQALESDNIPLSLNARLFIASLFNNEES